MFSGLGASAFLPFLPMAPIQLMVQNLLYDSAQLALPWDRVDSDYQSAPRRWEARGLVRFMVIFGTLSSMFDLATFAVLWWVFGVSHAPTVFQTGWFVEGLLTQLLAVLVLRARVAPWRGARCSPVVGADRLRCGRHRSAVTGNAAGPRVVDDGAAGLVPGLAASGRRRIRTGYASRQASVSASAPGLAVALSRID